MLFIRKKLIFYGKIEMPTGCRISTALVAKMPNADGISKILYSARYTFFQQLAAQPKFYPTIHFRLQFTFSCISLVHDPALRFMGEFFI